MHSKRRIGVPADLARDGARARACGVSRESWTTFDLSGPSRWLSFTYKYGNKPQPRRMCSHFVLRQTPEAKGSVRPYVTKLGKKKGGGGEAASIPSNHSTYRVRPRHGVHAQKKEKLIKRPLEHDVAKYDGATRFVGTVHMSWMGGVKRQNPNPQIQNSERDRWAGAHTHTTTTTTTRATTRRKVAPARWRCLVAARHPAASTFSLVLFSTSVLLHHHISRIATQSPASPVLALAGRAEVPAPFPSFHIVYSPPPFAYG
ncbi:hypothetical protein F5148DRAFT_452200 [Russula earlei]|uniref:Uncharacterized protein n=1 Tax=Russula earlei TaxID=71964 RepID=A0ACC0TZS8_9AGAM|nr:hypothetical protein F5148DRAFT_452200 [Russula earlei]